MQYTLPEIYEKINQHKKEIRKLLDLRDQDIREFAIRNVYYPITRIAKEYEVSASLVSQILRQGGIYREEMRRRFQNEAKSKVK